MTSQQDGSEPRIVFRVLLVLLLAGVTGGAAWLFASPAMQQAGPVDPSADLVAAPVQPDTIAPSRSTVDSDVTGWAAKVSASTGIPARAVQAYGDAELSLRATEPDCHLSWNTLAGIGRIESDHGQYGGAQLNADGTETKPIIGVPLDGSAGVRNIPDTDQGTLDGDPVHDRAVGPMQFLPATWRKYADKGADPQNIDAAALAAGRYLCAGGRDLATARGWWAAILSYNDSVSYAQKVFGLANSYTRT